MIVTLADGSRVECQDKYFAQGTEGELFWDTAGTYVVKLYKDVEPQRELALQKIIGPEYSVVLTDSQTEANYWQSLFAWPQAIIKQPRLGITMCRAPNGTKELQWFLNSKTRKLLKPSELGTWRNSVEIAVKMARGVRRMHMKGLCHSDLSFRNFLVNHKTSDVFLIDCDGLVVPGVLPPNVWGTPGCIAPELIAQQTTYPPAPEPLIPSTRTDLHSLGTLIYWLLFMRHPLKGPKCHDPDPQRDDALSMGEKALFIEHPTDKANNLRNLPPAIQYSSMVTEAVQKLIRRAFVEGLHTPMLRPLAAEWERDLSRMLDSLVKCHNPQCPVGEFVLQPYQKSCRCVCGTPLTKPSYLPILTFYAPWRGRKGQFQPDRGYQMIGQPGRTLHEWHAKPTTQYEDPRVDHRPKAEVLFNRSKWFLKNLDFAELQIIDMSGNKTQAIRPGQQVELKDGLSLLLGPPDTSRLIYVQMLKLT